jgi:hypothetical protein
VDKTPMRQVARDVLANEAAPTVPYPMRYEHGSIILTTNRGIASWQPLEQRRLAGSLAAQEQRPASA